MLTMPPNAGRRRCGKTGLQMNNKWWPGIGFLVGLIITVATGDYVWLLLGLAIGVGIGVAQRKKGQP